MRAENRQIGYLFRVRDQVHDFFFIFTNGIVRQFEWFIHDFLTDAYLLGVSARFCLKPKDRRTLGQKNQWREQKKNQI
jgi:hypothetical protein